MERNGISILGTAPVVSVLIYPRNKSTGYILKPSRSGILSNFDIIDMMVKLVSCGRSHGTVLLNNSDFKYTGKYEVMDKITIHIGYLFPKLILTGLITDIRHQHSDKQGSFMQITFSDYCIKLQKVEYEGTTNLTGPTVAVPVASIIRTLINEHANKIPFFGDTWYPKLKPKLPLIDGGSRIKNWTPSSDSIYRIIMNIAAALNLNFYFNNKGRYCLDTIHVRDPNPIPRYRKFYGLDILTVEALESMDDLYTQTEIVVVSNDDDVSTPGKYPIYNATSDMKKYGPMKKKVKIHGELSGGYSLDNIAKKRVKHTSNPLKSVSVKMVGDPSIQPRSFVWCGNEETAARVSSEGLLRRSLTRLRKFSMSKIFTGKFYIVSVTHNVNKSGFTTTLELSRRGRYHTDCSLALDTLRGF